MNTKIAFFIGLVLANQVAQGNNQNVLPQPKDIVMIGCTAPGPSGGVVYSLDRSKFDAGGGIDKIVLPPAVKLGAPCLVAVQAMNKSICDGVNATWTVPGGFNAGGNRFQPPELITVAGPVVYSLTQYTFYCR